METPHSKPHPSALWAVFALVILSIAVMGFTVTHKLGLPLSKQALYVISVAEIVLAAASAATAIVAVAIGWIAAPPGSALRFVRALRVPIAIALTAVIAILLLPKYAWLFWASIAARTFAAALAGWLLARKGRSLWQCALAGAFLFFLDHVIVKTVSFAVASQWLPILGVLITFAMLAFVPIGLAAAGGYAASKLFPSSTPVEAGAGG